MMISVRAGNLLPPCQIGAMLNQAPLDEARSLGWVYSIDLGHGLVTSGLVPRDVLEAQAGVVFLENTAGKILAAGMATSRLRLPAAVRPGSWPLTTSYGALA